MNIAAGSHFIVNTQPDDQATQQSGQIKSIGLQSSFKVQLLNPGLNLENENNKASGPNN